jgi:hypothetical protein
MAKMKAINPKVTEMRERLKDKPQQMQQEMMLTYSAWFTRSCSNSFKTGGRSN